MSTQAEKFTTNAQTTGIFDRDEKLFRALIEHSSDAIALFDGAGRFVYVSPSTERILGYASHELLGRPGADLMHPDDLAHHRKQVFAELMQQPGKTITAEYRYRHKDGLWRWIEGVTTNWLADPSVGAIVTNFRDITERKYTEEQARFLAEVSKILASTLDYQTTLANIARLVVPQLADWFAVDLIDAEGHFELIEIEHANPEKVRWARALRSKHPIDPQAPRGAPNVVRTGQSELYADITDEMLVASARNDEELAIARQVAPTSVMIVPLVARGKTLGVVTFVSAESGRRYDATDVALAEEVGRRAGVALDNAILYRQVRESRNQLHFILQGVADGITVQDASGKVIYANDVAATMSGFPSAAAMLAAPMDVLVQALNRFELKDERGTPFPSDQLPGRRALRGEKDVQAVVQYDDTATGQIRWSLVKAQPIFDEQGHVQFAVNVITDLTERHALEQRKDEFISMTSHELKTPVTSLKGFTHLLQRRLAKQGDEQGLYFLARIDAQLNKLTKLIRDLLDLSRMQSGNLVFEEARFDVATLVQETVETLQTVTPTHHILLDEKAEAQVMGDRDRLGQVLVNLLTNAIKYSPHADKVIVHIATDGVYVTVSVQDFGIGIAAAHHQKIFERFYQVTDPEGKSYPGLGIGLYISQEIVKRHHGRLWVESKKGEGATFYMTLPLVKEG